MPGNTTFEFPDIADHPQIDVPVNPLLDFPRITRVEDIPAKLTQLSTWMNGWASFSRAEWEVAHAMLKRVGASSEAYLQYKKNFPRRGPLASQGILTARLDTSGLAQALKTEIFNLRKKRVKDPLPLPEIDRVADVAHPEAKAMVSSLLDRGGFRGDLKNYMGHDPDIVSVKLQVSRPSDLHHYQTFRDLPYSSGLLNLHMDPKPGVMKAIVYLSDVGEYEGPFQFIPGSGTWEVDEIERCFAWGVSTGNYLSSRSARRVGCALPPPYRRTAIVGKVLRESQGKYQFLRRNLRSFDSRTASVMVFDPCVNFHRGGLVQEGERINLQVVMK
jgi:hypothetical protein